MPLPAAQQLLGKPGLVTGTCSSRTRGGVARARDAGRCALLAADASRRSGSRPTTRSRTRSRRPTQTGAAFMSLFTTFGSFSIAAGILLIFLIFVMLAAERRGELGIARAVGTRRGHLVADVPLRGRRLRPRSRPPSASLLGIAVAYGMVLVMASAFARDGGLARSRYSVKPASVVARLRDRRAADVRRRRFSAWRVSRMNIVTRDPQPARAARARRRAGGAGCSAALGARCSALLLVVAGVGAKDAVTLGLGVSLVILSLVPIAARWLGVPERARAHRRRARARRLVRAADQPLAVRRAEDRTSRSSSSAG